MIFRSFYCHKQILHVSHKKKIRSKHLLSAFSSIGFFSSSSIEFFVHFFWFDFSKMYCTRCAFLRCLVHSFPLRFDRFASISCSILYFRFRVRYIWWVLNFSVVFPFCHYALPFLIMFNHHPLPLSASWLSFLSLSLHFPLYICNFESAHFYLIHSVPLIYFFSSQS